MNDAAQKERLEKDAARYQWAMPILTGSASDRNVDARTRALFAALSSGLDGDAAIDAAMTACPAESRVSDAEDAAAFKQGYEDRIKGKFINPYDAFKQRQLYAAWLTGHQAGHLAAQSVTG